MVSTMATILDTLILCFSDYVELAIAVETHSLMGIEGGGEGGNGPIFFSASQEGPKMHHEAVATTSAADDGRCVRFGRNECNKTQQLTM